MRDLTRSGIRIALELWLNTEKDWLVEEHLDLMIYTGLMDNVDHVIDVIEEEQANILLPFMVKLLRKQLEELQEELAHGES